MDENQHKEQLIKAISVLDERIIQIKKFFYDFEWLGMPKEDAEKCKNLLAELRDLESARTAIQSGLLVDHGVVIKRKDSIFNISDLFIT